MNTEKQSAEEILKDKINNHHWGYNYSNIESTDGTMNDFLNIALSAMKEYASQFKQPDISEDVLQELGEKEVMIIAFDKVRKMFDLRSWIMQSRGSYPYDDDRYKEEVRYLFDEFDALQKGVWKNIKTKTFEYRDKIIEDYKKSTVNERKDTPETIGQILKQAIEFHELKPEFIDRELKLQGTLDKLINNECYTNSIPVKLFKNLIVSLHIPFTTIEKAMLPTYRLIASKETKETLNKKPSGYVLWENEGAIIKYTERLKELMYERKDNVGSVIKMIDEVLLNKAKELNLYVDFSDKEYDGDKEAPMDRIVFMEYILKQYNAENNVWINIKEDWMPCKDTWVLVCTFDDNIFVSYYDSDFEQIIENKGITHWMPLPAPPESQPQQKEV